MLGNEWGRVCNCVCEVWWPGAGRGKVNCDVSTAAVCVVINMVVFEAGGRAMLDNLCAVHMGNAA